MECGQLFDGKYRISKVLGEGGMGKVYLGENMKLGTLWAIKEIKRKDALEAYGLAEPHILKKLNHPALPRIFDIIEEEDYIYVVVDYIEGVSLDRKLETEGRFKERTVLEWARQLCDVLHYLHTFRPNPIIYRDMKPSNIILTGEGSVKLVDFGIAREYKPESETDTVYIGTRGYAAPEQYGAGQTGVTTDIYSLGVTLYHLLTGKSPNEPPYELKPVRHFNPELSEELECIIARCTRPDPAERYPSAAELLADIDALLQKGKSCGGAGNSGAYGFPDRSAGMGAGDAGLGPADADGGFPGAGTGFGGFKKLVLTIWDNAEFGCELAYTAARLTDYSVMLMDLDLLNPKADLVLNVSKAPDRILTEGLLKPSGLSIVTDALEKSCLSPQLLKEASVKRRELKNLYILTGNYRLGNYEYFSDDSLVKLIEKSYQYFDMTVLLVNRSIYDSYTVISLIKSDVNILAAGADIMTLREFNRCLSFLWETQQIPPDKTKFAAFEYRPQVHLTDAALREATGNNYAGSIRYSSRRAAYRNLRIPFARRMEKEVQADYTAVLLKFKILPRRTLKDKAREGFAAFAALAAHAVKPVIRKWKRRQGIHAGHPDTP